MGSAGTGGTSSRYPRYPMAPLVPLAGTSSTIGTSHWYHWLTIRSDGLTAVEMADGDPSDLPRPLDPKFNIGRSGPMHPVRPVGGQRPAPPSGRGAPRIPTLTTGSARKAAYAPRRARRLTTLNIEYGRCGGRTTSACPGSPRSANRGKTQCTYSAHTVHIQ